MQDIEEHTGWSWSDETGASITPDMEPAWADFLKGLKDAKPFKNHGWVHRAIMVLIMPVAVRGTHVFRPSQGITGMGPSGSGPGLRAPVEEEDEEDEEGENETTPAAAPVAPAIVVGPSFCSVIHCLPGLLDKPYHTSSWIQKA